MGKDRTEKGKAFASNNLLDNHVESPGRPGEKSSPDHGCEEARWREAVNGDLSRTIESK
jgi:hypothetical protein